MSNQDVLGEFVEVLAPEDGSPFVLAAEHHPDYLDMLALSSSGGTTRR